MATFMLKWWYQLQRMLSYWPATSSLLHLNQFFLWGGKAPMPCPPPAPQYAIGCCARLIDHIIKHSFAEQRLDYQLIKILNVHGSMLYARKVQYLFFYAFKTFVKYEILNNYVDRCYEAN